jgi:trans-aconitate methyltransferase
MTDLAREAIPLGLPWMMKYRATRALCGAISRRSDFPTRFAKIEARVGGRSKWLDDAIYRIKRWTYSERTCRANLGRANGGGTSATDFGSGYGYADPEEDRRIALFYKQEAESGKYSARETPVLNAHVVDTISDLLVKRQIRRVINFGVCYAEVDANLAQRFPAVSFTGIDRSPAIKEINEQSFNLPNLKFVAADVLEWMAQQDDLVDSLLFHMRTATLLPKPVMVELYRVAAERKLAAVCGFETYGFSRELDDWYEQDVADKPSVLYRDDMYLHNYVGILAGLGYRVDRLTYVKTPHVDADYRIQSFTAERHQ